jgi:hypothetical protein
MLFFVRVTSINFENGLNCQFQDLCGILPVVGRGGSILKRSTQEQHLSMLIFANKSNHLY